VKSVIFFSIILFLVGCSEGQKTISRYSEMGPIHLEKNELVLQNKLDNKSVISKFVDGLSGTSSRKKYIFVDIETGDLSNAAATAEFVGSRLKAKPFIHYDVKYRLVSGADASNKQVIRVKTLFFKPRDCTPTEKSILEKSGGYNGLEFGCAYVNNIGAMVDNPRDIIAPRGSESVNSQRTMRMLRAYIDGDATGSALPENEAGEASEVTSSD
jgi:type IV pilus biogenesis protein CpaD/CtpE